MIFLLRTIVLLGCLQGAVISVLLLTAHRHRGANRLLGFLILLISLASLKIYGNDAGWFEGGLIPMLFENFFPFFVIMPIGPLIYFYVRSYLEPGFALGKRDRIHFYSAILDLVPVLTAVSFILFALVTGGKHDPRPVGVFIDDYNSYVDIPRWLSAVAYTVAAARYLKRAHPATPVRWLRQFVLGFLIFECIWLVHLIPYEILATSNMILDRLGWYPLYVPLSVLSYWLGIKGYLLAATSPTPAKALPADLIGKAVPVVLRSMVTDKLYRDPDLKLSALAKHTGLPPKTLSAVLNQHLHKSFNEFVNEYRVLEIQQRLLAEGRGQLTIAGLAYECGFNSQPTFQRAFKVVTGISPREFLLKSGIE